MITPRRTRLIRVPDLHEFRRAMVDWSSDMPEATPFAIVVPTSAAARQLRRTLDHDRGAIVTRDALYDSFHARLDRPPRRLTPLEREVMVQAAARDAAARTELSFQLRPGLVAEMLRFYDHLRRQSRQVGRFEELIDQSLPHDDLDRGAVRMRKQTSFLADAFRGYERRVIESDGCDEHTLRDRLIGEPAEAPIVQVLVSVADWIADPAGLFSADFDLLTRIPGLARLDIVCTGAVLRTGFDERLHTWWPGVEDTGIGEPAPHLKPVMIVPHGAASEEPWWVVRDREEELIAIARQIKTGERNGTAVPLERRAVVFKAPLPYLYLADEVFRASRIAFDAFDALPLATEPTAAALDLVFDAVESNFTRGTLIALLRSPHFRFDARDGGLTSEAIGLLDRALSDARYLGDPRRLDALPSSPAVDVARQVASDLLLLAEPRPASQQIAVLRDFWTAHLRPLEDDDPMGAREQRARESLHAILTALETVHAAHDDPIWSVRDLALAVRRSIEEETAVPARASDRGLQLMDDQAVRYGAFDDLFIVGIVEAEWPERPRRNIFYPPSLLQSLGWPSEKDRRAAADARFIDLLGSAARRTQLFTFTLDDDRIVSRSLQLDEVPRAGLTVIEVDVADPPRVFIEEAVSMEPVMLDRLDAAALAWAQLRASRASSTLPDFHGTIGDETRAGVALSSRGWSVSALETYLDCPFKFFAQHVLRLEEDPDDEEVMDPRRQGQFVHQVFEDFFKSWQSAGHGAITEANLDRARDLFGTVVERSLDRLPAGEAGLERTRLLGSSAAAGLGEAVFRMEAERPVAVVERLLEHRLEGEFTIVASGGPRRVVLRGKADRVDLLEDGTFRLIDYKLGWPPNRARALQLPIYSVCAEQRLATHRGRSWTLGEAAYLAFKGPRRVVPLFTSSSDRDKVLGEAQQRLADTLEAIAAGEFPPRPDDVYRCETCSFAAVCRKDYVGD